MQTEFYIVVSQILPVLFLAISIQSIFVVKGVKYSKEETFPRNIHILEFITLMCILVLGEIVALKCVYRNTSSIRDLGLIIFTMGVTVLWVVVEYVLLLLGKSKEIFYLGLLLIGVSAILLFTTINLI